MRRSLLRSATLAVVVAAGVGACSSDDGDAAGTTSTTTPATTSTTAATTSSTAASGSSGSTTTTSAAGTPPCETAQLSGELGPTNAGAGQLYQPVVLRNTGSEVCEVRGFPGVSLLDGSGGQLGEPAGREGPEGAAVVLQPGDAASATLHTTNEGLGVPCEPSSAQVRVFPPDRTEAVTFSGQFMACGGFTVTTLVAGDTGVA